MCNPRQRVAAASCGAAYFDRGLCSNYPRCPRKQYRQRYGNGALLEARARWALIVEARRLWRVVRVAFKCGLAVKFILNGREWRQPLLQLLSGARR